MVGEPPRLAGQIGDSLEPATVVVVVAHGAPKVVLDRHDAPIRASVQAYGSLPARHRSQPTVRVLQFGAARACCHFRQPVGISHRREPPSEAGGSQGDSAIGDHPDDARKRSV